MAVFVWLKRKYRDWERISRRVYQERIRPQGRLLKGRFLILMRWPGKIAGRRPGRRIRRPDLSRSWQQVLAWRTGLTREGRLLLGAAGLAAACAIIPLTVSPALAPGAAPGTVQARIVSGDASPGSEVSRGSPVSRDDVYLMARVIEGEAANEPYPGKVAVGAVIINRTRASGFPHNVPGVIYQPDAFEAVTNGQYLRPLNRESLEAAQAAVNGQDPTGGALYYWNPDKAKSRWVWSRPVVTRIGRHVFAR